MSLATAGHSLVLLGLPGSGKTKTVKDVVHHHRENGVTVAVTASTGTACLQYDDAVTIHR